MTQPWAERSEAGARTKSGCDEVAEAASASELRALALVVFALARQELLELVGQFITAGQIAVMGQQ